MRSSLALTALAATFAVGSCQFQFQFLHRRQGTQEDGAVSSSFFSSSSWFRGNDGEMHKQTKTSETELLRGNDGEMHQQTKASSTEITQDGSEMKKRMVCRDGSCQEVVEVLESPTIQEEHAEHAAALRGILDRLIGNMQHPHQQQPVLIEPVRNTQTPNRLQAILDHLYGNLQHQRPQQPEIIIERPNQPDIIIEPISSRRWHSDVPLNSALPGVRPWFPDSPNERAVEIEIEIPAQYRPPQVQQPAPQAPDPAADMTFVKVAVALVALGAAYALVMSALNCYRVDQVSARERPLRDLSEPLAPASVNVAIPGAAAKEGPVRMYLSSLYTRANAKIEVRGVTAYVARLYTRILA